MNFDFIPYQLNIDISDFKGNVEYVSSDNGVDLYRAKDGFIEQILGIPVIVANLYFFEGSLITAYIRLGELAENLCKVKEALERATLEQGRLLKADVGLIHYWQTDSEFLGLLVNNDKNILLLYHTLNKFNAFKP